MLSVCKLLNRFRKLLIFRKIHILSNTLAKSAIGTYAAVLHALGGMDKDSTLIAKDDEFGRKLQDLDIRTRGRAKRRK